MEIDQAQEHRAAGADLALSFNSREGHTASIGAEAATFCGGAWAYLIGSPAVSAFDKLCAAFCGFLAGLRWGKTGFCHQMANRILDPAKITVAGTQGYFLSSMVFGRYGHPPWPERITCYAPGMVLAPRIAAVVTPQSSGTLSTSGIVNVSAIATGQGASMTEFLMQAEAALPGQLDPSTRAELGVIEARLQATQARLLSLLDHREITANKYVDDFHAALRTAMEQSRAVLGNERFYAVFGKGGDQPEDLLDRETFIASHHSLCYLWSESDLENTPAFKNITTNNNNPTPIAAQNKIK